MRGLTLIEVLAAVVLLAFMAAATLPWITDARRLSEWTEPSTDPPALGDLADAVLSDPEAFSLPQLLEIGSSPIRAMTDDGHLFSIRRVNSESDEPTHAWLVFEMDDRMTARVIRLPREPRP